MALSPSFSRHSKILTQKANFNLRKNFSLHGFQRQFSSPATAIKSSNESQDFDFPQKATPTLQANINVKTAPKVYDVFILGGGITGTALMYYLSKFTDIKSIGICERRNSFAKIASSANNNSQTIHCGDIETNYTLSKAKSVKKFADMLRNHITKLPNSQQEKITGKYQKMVLGVGESECEFLENRAESFKQVFKSMELVGKSQIAELEPRVALLNSHNLRPDNINALVIQNEHVAINYKALSDSFVSQVTSNFAEKTDIFLNTEVEKIIPESDQLFTLKTKSTNFQAKFVVVSACGYSLLMAHKLGYGLEYSCLPVSGSFYFTPPMLNGKVYTVQNPELPFAAIHGDPDLVATDKTRFGPTALPLPMLERYNNSSIKDFFEVWKPDAQLFDVYWKFLKNSTLRNYVIRNFLFEIPYLNTKIFLKDAQKIVPSLKLNDLSYAEGFGGVRPQLIDKIQKKLVGGEGKISPKSANIIFNITPSPGGTTCIGAADQDARTICEKLGARINEQLFEKEILQGEYPIDYS